MCLSSLFLELVAFSEAQLTQRSERRSELGTEEVGEEQV
jgi:hypothetical protein